MSDTLLLVEDEELLRTEMQRHLARQGWDVLTAATLADAERTVRRRGQNFPDCRSRGKCRNYKW